MTVDHYYGETPAIRIAAGRYRCPFCGQETLSVCRHDGDDPTENDLVVLDCHNENCTARHVVVVDLHAHCARHPSRGPWAHYSGAGV